MSILSGGSVECVDESVSFIELDSPWHIVTTLLNTVPTFMNQKDPKIWISKYVAWGLYLDPGRRKCRCCEKSVWTGTRRKEAAPACLHIMHQLNFIVLCSLFRLYVFGELKFSATKSLIQAGSHFITSSSAQSLKANYKADVG